ncbi:protein TOPAZ1 isoform X3 [Xiphias gladius]|uniref:protein TOPAZ1 isoform X3 n=1 Tax=Xiphias gladius TaxID=8245 RepID=UPI001A986B65|nr:protein TOPAZ1 isoform X3 [Xiphias gladius]
MFPSSSKVKLNRVALKDVVGLKLVPRRRRVLPNNVTVASKQQEEKQEDSQVMSGKDTASVPNSNETVQSSLTDQMGPDSVTHTARNITEGEPEDNCVDIDRNTHPSPIGLAGSEGSLRRAFTASRCGLCGDCKYISPQQKTLGKRTNKRECKTSMWDRDVKEDPGLGVEIYRDKRIKLEDSVKDGNLLSTPDLESIICNDTAKTCFIDNEKTCSEMSNDSQSCLELKFGGCSTYRSPVKENCVHKKPCGQMGKPRKTDAAQMSSELFCQRNEVDTDELESFTCQRVRVYCRKINFTCARTYMSWPFSNIDRTLTAHAGTIAGPAELIHPSARNNSDSPKNQNQSGPLSSRTDYMLPNAPTDPSSDTTHQVCHQNEEKQEEDGEHIIAKRNGKRHANMSSYSSNSKNMEFAPNLTEAEETLASLVSDKATLSTLSQQGRELGTDTVSASSTPVNGQETDSSMSTPSPLALGLSDWETATTLSPMSSLFTHGGLNSLSATPSSLPPSSLLLEKVKGLELAEAHSASTSSTSSSPKHNIQAVEKPFFYCEETQMTLCCSSPRPSSVPSHNSDFFHSCESSLLLPQDEQGSDKGTLSDMSPPQLEPYYNTNLCNRNLPVALEQCVVTNSNDFTLPPLLSPVTSPQGHLFSSFLPQSQCCSDEEEEEEEIQKDPSKQNMLSGHHMPQIGNGNRQNCEEYLVHHQHEGHSNQELEGVSSIRKTPTSHIIVGNVKDGIKEESHDKTDYKDDVEQCNRSSEQFPSAPKIRANLTSGALTERCSSPGYDQGQPCSSRDEGSTPSEIAGSERDKTEAEAAGDAQPCILNEFTAYEQDILLVDVIQDDPELFENLPEESLLKLGPTRVSEALKTRLTGAVKTLSPRIDAASLEFEQRSTPVVVNFPCDSHNITEENNSRPWRPQCSSTTSSKMQNNTWPATDKQTRNMGQSDDDDNRVNGGLERNQPIQTVNSPHNIPPLMTVRNGPWITTPVNMTDFRRQKSNAYCRQYFSESLSCGFKMCRFQHVPVEGDEKFCVETVARFIKNPMCLQKAGAVFTGYYQNNPPGVYFSMPVLLSLLQALLKAGMVSDVLSVLSVSLAHKIVPGHEFLLALFNFVREKGLMGSVPELMQLTFKMASAGLVLSLDCLDCVRNTPEFQQTVHPNSPVLMSGNHKLSTSAPFPEYLNLAHSIVELELCTKQEDWRRMGQVFRSICQSSQHPNQVEQISGRIAIALLSESKDKLSLPYAAFAETVCQTEDEDTLIQSFLGRIGVSLMLRYHKTHQWTKGRRVVEVLSISKVSYSTLKGLFGNEDGASRCYLVTVATELFLLSGSVEGALNTLRENNWFLSSYSWPCEPADLDSRSRVLMRLAEKTSHRDTLEVLSNLPGMKEPNDLIDISRYGPLFNSHLQVCVDRQILPLASDSVDFMLSKNLAVDHAMLQILLHKLGKQNLWLRAREVFRHSLSVGYYPGVSAPPGFMALIVPCQLGEVELALAFEMFITVNATVMLQLSETTTSCLSITLKRTERGESEYLSAGSRLLSAACIPQPKLIVHYKAVNSAQEQVFTLDISSARRWLRHNHLWANEVWTH